MHARQSDVIEFIEARTGSKFSEHTPISDVDGPALFEALEATFDVHIVPEQISNLGELLGQVLNQLTG